MNVAPLEFGSVKIDFPVVLAPMAGYTDAAMRTICLEHGAGAVYSELTSAEGLRRDSERTVQVLETSKEEFPIAGHIFGKDPDAMLEAAKFIEQSGEFDWIDLNCGCPVKKVVSRGAGAALMKDLPLLATIIKKIKKEVSLPLSVKTRIGFNNNTANHLEIARVVEESGADMLAVHARLAKNFHGGEADWDKLAEIKQALSIPIIGNGGLDQPSDVRRMFDETGVDGAMVGRAAIGNPWFFEQVRNPDFVVTASMRGDMMRDHLLRLVALNISKQNDSTFNYKYTPEEAACIQFRTHIPYYTKGLFDKKQLLLKLSTLLTVKDICTEVDILMRKNGN